MFTHSFAGVTPSARFDGLPWTAVLVEEASVPAGPFTQIASVAIPADSTPAVPDPVNITVTTATLAAGYFRFRFTDAASNLSPYTAVIASPDDAVTMGFSMPTVAQVAVYLRARTKNKSGVEVGTFTADTRPTDTQAQELIEQASLAIYTRVGLVVGAMGTVATSLAAIRAAMLIELAYFPEQVRGEQSPYPQLKELYDEGMVSLVDADIDGTVEAHPEFTSVNVVSPVMSYGYRL